MDKTASFYLQFTIHVFPFVIPQSAFIIILKENE